jgi:hypothetical protein
MDAEQNVLTQVSLERPDGPDPVYWITDTQHPESRAWQVGAQAPGIGESALGASVPGPSTPAPQE